MQENFHRIFLCSHSILTGSLVLEVIPMLMLLWIPFIPGRMMTSPSQRWITWFATFPIIIIIIIIGLHLDKCLDDSTHDIYNLHKYPTFSLSLDSKFCLGRVSYRAVRVRPIGGCHSFAWLRWCSHALMNMGPLSCPFAFQGAADLHDQGACLPNRPNHQEELGPRQQASCHRLLFLRQHTQQLPHHQCGWIQGV